MAYTYRLRIRNAADSADALVVTSLAGGTNPYIMAAPTGDGQSLNPRSGETSVGAYVVRVADNGSGANAITGFLSDGNGRYDKLGRLAYLEYSTDGGVTWPNLLVAGYVTQIRYPSAAEAAVTIGEAQRAERTKKAFEGASTNFPATTMLGGGPIRWPSATDVIPLKLANLGRWTVKRADSAYTNPTTLLQFVSGYVLKDEKATDFTLATDGALPDYMRRRINTLVSTEVPGALVDATYKYYRHGNVFADVYAGDTFKGTFQACAQYLATGDTATNFFTQDGFLLEWTNSDLVGTVYTVYLYTQTISENAPLHILKHPVDIVTGLIADAGEAYDSTTAASVKASLGNDLRVFLRITTSETTDAAITRLMGIFGFGRRMNGANKWEFFEQRAKGTSAPASTIALSDLREMPSDIWTLADSTIINNVTLVAHRFAIWAPGQSSTRPADCLVPVEARRTARLQLADGSYPDTTQGVKQLAYDLPGLILDANATERNLTDFVTALAAPAFDRWGYGAPSTALVCRPTVTAQIGDEVTLNLGFLPNGSARGGTRIVQVLQRTNEPGGPVLVVEDAGSSAQPSVAPTFTIAASTRNPRAAADVTLTNAAALVAAGVVAVLVEFAVSVGSPASNGQDLGSIVTAAPLVLTTPECAAGSTVWARAKSVQPGRRPSAWTAWASVALTAVGAASVLTFTANGSDGSQGTLAWTAGSNSSSYSVRVLLRSSALTSASDVPVAVLLPGSVSAALSGLTPSASYTATVQYYDPLSGLVAATATLTFAAGGVTLTLPTPTNPVGVVGSTLLDGMPILDGTYGLNVLAASLPGTIEFWEAVETAVGAGTYGTAVLKQALAAVSGDVTAWRNRPPYDNLRRQLTARHVRAGATASAYTAAVTVNPWAAVMRPPKIDLGWPIVAGATLANIADDAGTNRRAATANEKTGGARAQRVLDASDRLVNPTDATVLVDMAGKAIQSGLAIGPNVRGDASVAFGSTVKYTPNRHNERVVGRNEDTGGKTFSASFDNIPEVKPLLETFTIPGTNSTLARRFEVKATNVSVSGFTPRAVYTTGPSNVAKSEQFSPTLNGTRQATNALSAQGAVCYCDLSQANSTSTTYNVKYDVNTVGMSSVLLRVQVYKNRGSSGVNETTWDLVGTQTYDTGLSLTGEVISFTAALGLDFDVRVVLSYTATPASTATVTVKTCDYNAVTAGTESSLTPDADSAITFMAVEKS